MDGYMSISIIHFHEIQRIQFDCQGPGLMKKKKKTVDPLLLHQCGREVFEMLMRCDMRLQSS